MLVDSKLQAGRELNVLIAEEVMGYIVKRLGDYSGELDDQIAYFGADHPLWIVIDGSYRSPSREDLDVHGVAWCPSTNITDAWKVIERTLELLGESGLFGLRYYQNRDWQATFANAGTVHVREVAPTASSAICLAALKVIERIRHENE